MYKIAIIKNFMLHYSRKMRKQFGNMELDVVLMFSGYGTFRFFRRIPFFSFTFLLQLTWKLEMAGYGSSILGGRYKGKNFRPSTAFQSTRHCFLTPCVAHCSKLQSDNNKMVSYISRNSVSDLFLHSSFAFPTPTPFTLPPGVDLFCRLF